MRTLMGVMLVFGGAYVAGSQSGQGWTPTYFIAIATAAVGSAVASW